jgi:hypothetical protein
MRARGIRGRLIGLLAAYLVALQALALPLAMPASPAFAGGLCLGSGHSGAPAKQVPGDGRGCPSCAGCGLFCEAPSLAAAPAVIVPAPPPHRAAVLTPALRRPPLPAARRTPQVPRGPPAA